MIERLVVAIGGNATHPENIRGTTEEQEQIAPMRPDVCVAHNQGGIGHLLMQGLEDELARAEYGRRVACFITRAVVDADDEAFATGLCVDALLILTAVPRVALHFRKPRQRELETVTASELDGYRREGHFAEGSMRPKVKAALRFLATGGKRPIIAHLDHAADALAGKAGTQVIPG